MNRFNEEKLELAIIDLLGKEGYPHVHGETIARPTAEVLLKDDLREFLASRYAGDGITENEMEQIIRRSEKGDITDIGSLGKKRSKG